jgi:REP element-mobilizing transposase RayT
MPNHIHIALWAEKSSLVKAFITQMLRKSSKELYGMAQLAAQKGNKIASSWMRVFENQAGSGNRSAIWKERGRAFPVHEMTVLNQKLTYIHENPVRMGLIENIEDWEFSSASWFTSGTGPLAIDKVEIW